MFAFIFFLVLLVLVLLGILWVVMHLLGFRMVQQHARTRTRYVLPETEAPPVRAAILPADTRSTLLAALNRPPFTDQLLPEQRDALRHALLAQDPMRDSSGIAQPTQAASTAVVSPLDVPAQTARAPRRAMVETVRASWDPAVMLLYLGALLVVIAGLIFASYSWGTWGGWQKLGMLIGATAAFLVAGFALQRYERIRPAARTFITIGGLLVPANALAAYTIFRDAEPLLILFAGASVTALIHGVLSAQPQSFIFRYTTVATLLLAIASLPGAFGLRAAWGCVLALALVAVPPDPWGRMERFARAWMLIGAASILPLAGIGIISNQGEQHWVVPALLVALSISLNRVGQRAPTMHIGLNVVAEVVAVSANVTAAWILTGDQWLLATLLLSVGLILIRYSRVYLEQTPLLETFAAFPLAGFLGVATNQLATAERGVTVFFVALTLAMLLVAYRWPKLGAVTHGVAVITLPAIFFPLLNPLWDVAVFATILTVTLIAWRSRYRDLGDVPYAFASIATWVAIFAWGNALDIESSLTWTWILTLSAIAGTLLANLASPRVLANWVRHLMRVETIIIFLIAFALDEAYAAVLIAAILAMGWNVWASRHAFWSLPGAGFIILLFELFVIPPLASAYELWWLYTVLSVLLGGLAWQLDRRTAFSIPSGFSAGVYVWAVVAIISLGTATQVEVNSALHPVGIAMVLLVMAALYGIAVFSSRIRLFVLPALTCAVLANSLLLHPAVSDSDHAIIVGGLVAAVVVTIWRPTVMRSRLGFTLLALAVLHLNAVFDQSAIPGVLVGLVAAWLVLSLGLARGRTETGGWQLREAALQAAAMHVVALVGPYYGTADVVFSRPALVLSLISLAGTIGVYGMMVRSRWHMFLASAVAMAALMLQINSGQPGNVHAYTVPLAVYLLGVGLLLHPYPRTANVLLAAGSGVLVVPAMLEALTTGSLTWLWIALAEALALFLMGTVLQLRIPTAAAVIAVSVIALRMLVMAINAYASWISMLAIGVALLLLGTLWLIYRDAIQDRLHGVFSRWLAFH